MKFSRNRLGGLAASAFALILVLNYDDLQIQFGNATYVLSCEYGAGKIDADFARISVKP